MSKKKSWLVAAAVAFVTLSAYLLYQSRQAVQEFEQRRWDAPAYVYASPFELYIGRTVDQAELIAELRRLGYRPVEKLLLPGSFTLGTTSIELITRDFQFDDGYQPAGYLKVFFENGKIKKLLDKNGQSLALFRLDPLLIGSIFAAHGEDRLIVTLEQVPPLLLEVLKAIEDRRFNEHIGIDFKSIGRAMVVNVRSGRIEQGGSTLTQQLVKNFFLSAERTFTRKIIEAAMAVVLEIEYEKSDILNAYLNEVYLGQDGKRAIHGFGLASQFYFDKRINELELHEIAFLVGSLRSPSSYNPRRFPERARTRRDLVLSVLEEQGVISAEEKENARAKPLGVIDRPGRHSAYHPAFLAMVREQLKTDYPEEELATQGLRVFATLDPSVQTKAEKALANGLDRIEASRGIAAGTLEGAVVVTQPASAEVLAIVGGRRSGFDGFNRALYAYRPAGSLLKPVVYLAALEQGYTFASVVEDKAISVPLDNGDTWTPTNYDDKAHGPVSMIKALADSYNLATVQLGMEIGVERVANLLQRLAWDKKPPAYPSLLLGSLEISPLQATQLYNSFANGGFRSKLRAVRAVMNREGELIDRYPLSIDQVSDAQNIYQLNQALVQVVERGTARAARRWLPESMKVAGKTGTSGDFRDSWFAGFSASHTVVVWVGNDENQPTGLTGSSGALTIWAPLINALDGGAAYRSIVPDGLKAVRVDYESGQLANERCGDTIIIAVPEDAKLNTMPGCGSDVKKLGNKLNRWLERVFK